MSFDKLEYPSTLGMIVVAVGSYRMKRLLPRVTLSVLGQEDVVLVS